MSGPETPRRIFTPEECEAFRARYAGLCREYGLHVVSCGCCQQWIEPMPSYEDADLDTISICTDPEWQKWKPK